MRHQRLRALGAFRFIAILPRPVMAEDRRRAAWASTDLTPPRQAAMWAIAFFEHGQRMFPNSATRKAKPICEAA